LNGRAGYISQLDALLHSCEARFSQPHERKFCRAGDLNVCASHLYSRADEKYWRANRNYFANSRKKCARGWHHCCNERKFFRAGRRNRC
jgi:hypothetical protein